MTEPPQPQSVLATITGKDLLDKLEALTTAMQAIAVTIDPLPKMVADHETRLRAVERRLWMACGGSVIVSGLVSVWASGGFHQ
jgi:hypothetical protein